MMYLDSNLRQGHNAYDRVTACDDIQTGRETARL